MARIQRKRRGAFRGFIAVLVLLAVLGVSSWLGTPSSSAKPLFSVATFRAQNANGTAIGGDGGEGDGADDDNDDDDGPKCEHIGRADDPCAFVRETESCDDASALLNYLEFRYCTMNGSNVAAAFSFVLMFLWLGLIISLLATTADNFFVPSLQYLSDQLKLSPAVAGITLLALGNGAPDVFTAIAGLQADDFALVLGALIGASMFISSVVLGSVLIVSIRASSDFATQVNRTEFLRDISVYIIATAVIVAIGLDKKIQLWESILFLVIYFLYVILVVYLSKRKQREEAKHLSISSDAGEPGAGVAVAVPVGGGMGAMHYSALHDSDLEDMDMDPWQLAGLNWPSDGNLWDKTQTVIEYPFSVLRWLSSAPADGEWNHVRRYLLIGFPMFFSMLVLLAAEGWDGFTMKAGGFPVWAIAFLCSIPLSVVVALTSNPHSLPVYYRAYSFFAFASSIAWLNIIANECVAVLESIGIEWNISTAILGLTVLAIGNSVGDFVADTAVARAGSPATAIASCFGSPLLNDVVGLGLALTITCAKQLPDAFTFSINQHVVIGWVFLAAALFSSFIVFPLTKYRPPKKFAYYLIALYVAFVAVSVLAEVGVINF